MLVMATKANGIGFAADEYATSSTIDHGMADIDFMIFCDENPLPILCECREPCKGVSDHNGRMTRIHGKHHALRG